MNDAFGLPQSVLVLGGSSEIGRAIAIQLVERRARLVILAGREGPGLEAAATAVREAGAAEVATVAWDATDVAGHTRALEATWARHGPIDLVLVAVGVLGDQERLEHDPAAAAAVLTTNFTGPAAALLAVADQLRAQGQGTIVVLSSVAGERVRRSNFVYGSSKAGLDGFCQGLADALAGSGARLVIVRPGFVRTRMTAGLPGAPLSVEPAAVATAVLRGLASGAPVIWVPGALRAAFVVLRHLPRRVFRLLPG